MLNSKIAGKYQVKKKIAAGTFGEVYLASISNGEEFALKAEKLSSRHPQLIYESKLLKTLHGAAGIPSVRWAGIEGNHAVMIIDLLGPSLEDLFSLCNRKFCLKTVLMLADQMLSRIEYIHTKGFIHRDIKPENFLIGLGKRSSLLYLIDFGLSKRYRDSKTHMHIPYKDGKHLTGTARYASLNTHIGVEQSRRDDLECIAYVLMYLNRGNLPWQGISAQNRLDKYRMIMDKKASISPEDLCRGFPDEFKVFLGYCKSLKFDEKPDYGYLKRLFKDLFISEGFEADHVYDWSLMNYLRPVRPVRDEEKKTDPMNQGQRKADERVCERKKKRTCAIF
jgi:serine/threonine protein kinase